MESCCSAVAGGVPLSVTLTVTTESPVLPGIQVVLDAGVERGTLRAGLDTEMVVAMLFGAGIQRMLTGGDLPEQWPRRVVDAVWPLVAPAPGA